MKRTRQRGAAPFERNLAESVIWWGLQATLIGVSLIIADGHDVYRLPKQLLFEGATVILVAASLIETLIRWPHGILRRLAAHRWPLIIVAIAVGWTAIGTAFSTNRLLSVQTLLWVVCCAAFFLITVALAERRGIYSIAAALVGPVIVAGTAILQRLEIWSPVRFEAGLPLRLHTTGYIGNPNELAAYLVVPILAAVAAGITLRGAPRLVHLTLAVLLVGAVTASETLSALGAIAAGGLVLVILASRRTALRIAIATTVLIAIVFALNLPLAERLRRVATEVLLGNFEAAFSYRFQGALAAWKMFTEHPLLGVGPGCFAFWYLPYDAALFGTHPQFLLMGQNYHDVHNDHLQLLATTGLPGYAIYLGALWGLASCGRVSETETRRRFARWFAAPAAAAIAVVTLTQFPLELAAPMSMFLYFAALAISWSRAA